MAKKLIIPGDLFVRLPLYVSDAQVAEIVLGDRRDSWPAVHRQLEREGFPRQSRLVSGLRYLPTVIQFFDRRELGISADPYWPDGEENFEL